MAFVVEADRKLNELSKTMCPLGPGQYFKDGEPQKKKQCAPFQSSSKRRSFFEPSNNQSKPGPGNYEISQPFIEPNIKTVSNSQSIIVKINSTGTAQFKSIIDRFEVRDREVPGPGQYSYHGSISPKRKSVSQRSIQENSVIEKIKELNTRKNFPAIPEKTRGLTNEKKEEVNPEGKLGPAFYNPQKNFYLNSSSTVWGKDQCRRFSLDNRSEVGPGKYNPVYNPMKPQDKDNQPSAHFKSSTVRTYFDSLFYRTNISQKAKIRDQNNFRPKDPAPGQYQTNLSSLRIEQKPFAHQFFGSTVQRFAETAYIPDKKHKSFYNIRSEIGKNRSFNKSDHAFMSDTNRKPQFLQISDKDRNPGPGHYKENVKVQKKLKGNKLEKFGTNTKRQFQRQDVQDQVGPGKYEKDSQKRESPKNNKFGQVLDISSTFKSTTNRDCFGQKTAEKIPFAEYDVSHYDLAKRMQKQKNFIENLKKIDVEKAPFESSISRFPHYEDQPKNTRKVTIQQNRQQQIKLRKEEERVRDLILQANQSQVKEVRKNHFGNEQRFKSGRKGAPGVGQYSVKIIWEKKSHNVKFNTTDTTK